MSLGQKVLSGVVWTAFDLVVNKGFGLLIKLVLARLLLPGDYGIIGMAVVFINFAKVLAESGIGPAIVQMPEESLRREHLDTTFWTSVAWSGTLYLLIVYFVAPWSASFYGEPVLEQVVPILGIGILISPLNVVHRSQLTRAFKFKRIALINNIASVIGGIIAVALAYRGYGLWALVWYTILPLIIMLPQLYRATGYIPGLAISREAFHDIFTFGIVTMGTAVIGTFVNQLDYLLIGKMVSKYALGLYTFAFLLTDVARRQISTVLGSVMFPAYSSIQHDRNKMKKTYLKVMQLNCLAIFAPMTLLLVNATNIVTFFFGVKWIDSVILIQFLVVAALANAMTSGFGALLRGMGKVSMEFNLHLVRALLIFVPLLYFGVRNHGVLGAAVAVVLHQLISVPIILYVLKRQIGLEGWEFFRAMWPVVFAAAISTGVGLLSRQVIGTSDPATIIHAVLMLTTFFIVIYITMKAELTMVIFRLNDLRKRLLTKG